MVVLKGLEGIPLHLFAHENAKYSPPFKKIVGAKVFLDKSMLLVYDISG